MGKEGAKEEAKEDAKEKVADELKEAALGGDQSLDLKDLEVDEEAPGCRGCSWMPKKRKKAKEERLDAEKKKAEEERLDAEEVAKKKATKDGNKGYQVPKSNEKLFKKAAKDAYEEQK